MSLRRVILPSGNEAVYTTDKTDPVEIQRYGVHVATKIRGEWHENGSLPDSWRVAHLSDAQRYDRAPLYETRSCDDCGKEIFRDAQNMGPSGSRCMNCLAIWELS